MFDIGLCQLSDQDLVSELQRRFPVLIVAGVNRDDQFAVWRFGNRLTIRGAVERVRDLVLEQDA